MRICGVNRALIGAELLDTIQVNSKRAVGVDLYKKDWNDCFTILTGARGADVDIFKATAVVSCASAFKMFQPSVKFNRATGKYGGKGQAWAVKATAHSVPPFWCKKLKAEPECSELFVAASTAFYNVPAVLTAAPTPVVPPEAAVVDPNGAIAPAVIVPLESPAVLPIENTPTAEPLPVVEGQQNEDAHGLDVGGRDPILIYDSRGVIVVKPDIHGYIQVIPTAKSAHHIAKLYKKYVDAHSSIGLALASKETYKQTLQFTVQDNAVYIKRIQTLKEKIAFLPTITKEQKKIRAVSVTELKRLENQDGVLRGMQEILFLMERDRDSQDCRTPDNPEVLKLMEAMKKVVDFKVERNSLADQKKCE